MTNALSTVLNAPRAVMTILVAMVIAGTVAYITIPKEANPDIDVPVFYISVSQQGISPEDAERLLVRPLETRLRGLEGLKEITGSAREGNAGITLEFDVDFDKDAALADIRAEVDQAAAELPDEAEEPVIVETNFSLIPTIIVVLSGDVPERTLFQHARRLQDEIEGISTVLEANLSGQREELLEIVIDQTRLQSYGVSQQELLAAVGNNNQLVPAGALDTGGGAFNIKVPGLFETREDVLTLPIKVSGNGVVTLADVADIRRTFKDATTFTRINGKPAIAIEVVKRLGENIVENNKLVRDAVDSHTAEWSDAIEIDFILDESSYIFEVLGSLQASILTAIALVMIVVIAALGPRAAILIGFSIPTSFLIGFLILSLAGINVNIMVLFGLVLTVGMLVDGAIVIVEFADRKMAEGLGRRDAYIAAAQRMFWPITASTATTLAAFLPMLLWPGVPGEFMSYLPIMVVIVLSAALLTAMVFLPVIGGLIGGTSASKKEIEAARTLSGNHKLDISEFHGLTGYYLRFLNVVIRHPAKVLLVTGVVVFVIFDAFATHNNGVEFFVEEEPDRAVVLISARGNLAATEMRDLVIEVENEILQVSGIQDVLTNAGVPGGGQQLGDVEDKPVDTIGQITLEFVDYCCRRKAEEIFSDIRERTADLSGINVEIRKIEGGPPTGKDLRLEITAQSYDRVLETTARVYDHLNTGMEGLRDLEDTRPLPGIEWRVDVDREQAGRFGADVVSVGAMIQLVTNGVLVGTYRPDDAEDEIDIRVRLPEEERALDRIESLRIATPNGLVPLTNFIDRTAQQKVSSITRQNGRFAMTVKANTVDGVLADDKVRELTTWLDDQQWPDGVGFRFRGADEEQRESGAFLQQAAIGALFLMFVILVTQFNSFGQAILTLSTVVLAVCGVLIGMMLTGQRFSIIMTGTGIVALAGIVVNNAIVLLDTYNRLTRERGVDPIEAILKTAAQRLRPIFLTTFTTIMGLIPMATEINVNFFNPETMRPEINIGGITSVWWVQLSTAVVSGLAFATLITLIFVPTMVAMPTIYKRRYQEIRDSWRARRSGSATPAGRSEAPDTTPAPSNDPVPFGDERDAERRQPYPVPAQAAE
ncbi:MAG: efflux RND transporter permease subunit [Pseudomonadota bacterium]